MIGDFKYRNLVIRLLVLGIIVFIAVSYIPSVPLETDVKLLISLLVVVTYSIIDIAYGISHDVITKIKDNMCDIVC